MLLLRTLLILGVNAVNLCDRINRAHCMGETMIQATYSFMEEEIIWGQVWPWQRYVNTSGIRSVLSQLIHLASTLRGGGLCSILIVCIRVYACQAGLGVLFFFFFNHTKVLNTLALEIHYCVLRNRIALFFFFFLQNNLCFCFSAHNKGSSAQRFELTQSTCYKLRCAKECSKYYL